MTFDFVVRSSCKVFEWMSTAFVLSFSFYALFLLFGFG